LTPWSIIVAFISGAGGLGTLLALFVVPATKRNEDTQKRFADLERKIDKLTRSDANMRAIIVVLIQRDEMHSSRLRVYEPNVIIESMSDLLKRLNLSLVQIVGGTDEKPEEGE